MPLPELLPELPASGGEIVGHSLDPRLSLKELSKLPPDAPLPMSDDEFQAAMTKYRNDSLAEDNALIGKGRTIRRGAAEESETLDHTYIEGPQMDQLLLDIDSNNL